MAGTKILQTWGIGPDGHVTFEVQSGKPLDSAAIAALEGVVDAIETYVYSITSRSPEPFFVEEQ